MVRATALHAVGSLLIALLSAPTALAQSAEPMPEGASAGYELLLSGARSSARGHALTLVGVGYEVEGLASLRPRSGLRVEVSLTARNATGSGRRVVTQGQAQTEAGGRFEVELPVPSEPHAATQLEVRVGRPGGETRLFTFPFRSTADVQMELLTDRNRYQPGEVVHAWTRVHGMRSPTPIAGQVVQLELRDAANNELATAEGTTRASGAIATDLQLPESAEVGAYTVRARLADGSVAASRPIQVWRRTVERILAEIELRGRDEDGVAMVRPGGPLRGAVRVTTPSGTPIRGAQVDVRVRADAQPTTLTTNDEGLAPFDLRAPAFLSGEVGSEMLSARATHPAHGTLTVSTRYLVARVRAVVELTPRGGALVPEVGGTLYVNVNDPRGRPLPANTEVVLRGHGIPDTTTQIDGRGFAEVAVQLPRGASSQMQQGPCAGRHATTFEVEVRTTPAVFTRACVNVSAETEVVPVAQGVPVAAPGDTIEIDVRRRPSARGRPVLVEALFQGNPVAFAWADGRASRVRLDVPSDLLGVVHLRARALRPENDREPNSEPGNYALSRGGLDALLVRPADSFSLSVAPAEPRYVVREAAAVHLRSSRPTTQGWATLLVRDQAAHGGEADWELSWLQGALHEAAQAPSDQVNGRLLRAALAAGLTWEARPPAPGPLEAPYWRPNRLGAYRPGAQFARGILRDPVALREEMLRRGLGPFEQRLEQLVRSLPTDTAARARIVSSRGSRSTFAPDVIQNLVADRQLSRSGTQTLGGRPITVAMIERADPGFSFDTVARRVARTRLSRLLMGLLRLTNPDDPNAQRASANLPPERWLGTLVQLNIVNAQDLVDPWGHPYVFRRVGRPVIAVSERALEWELASPGPDGRIGTGDDVKDPFGRAVPEGTPYAVISGEDNFLRRVSQLAPASTVLTRMAGAYNRLALAAREEMQAQVTSASAGEVADEDMEFAEAERDGDGYGADDMLAGALGGAGAAPMRSRASGRMARPTSAPAPAADMAPEPEEAMRAELSQRGGENRVASAMGAMIREDFPATLFFAGEVPLDGADTMVEVPLADALTTYRLEAFAWTASGWTTSGAGRVRVDQRAVIDAPVPPFATVGDRLRLPVRVENRTDAPLEVRVQIEGEGELGFEPTPPVSATIPPHEAQEILAGLTLSDAGDGALVVAVSEADGTPLDAVRRPIVVRPDVRTARSRMQRLLDSGGDLSVDIPAEASERGPGQLRVSVGSALFGDPAELGDPLWAGWALTLSGEPRPEPIRDTALSTLNYEDDERDRLIDPMRAALALASAWQDERLTDADAARGLRSVSQLLPPPDARMEPSSIGERPAEVLLALSPIASSLGRRPSIRQEASRTMGRLAQLTSSHAAQATDSPTVWARAAAALALSGQSRGRAVEMVRRANRSRVAVGDIAWISPEVGGIENRGVPTALLALAEIELDQRASALALVRALVEFQREGAVVDPVAYVRARLAGDILPPGPARPERALASAAAGRLASASAPESVNATFDGQPLEIRKEGAVYVAVLDGIGRPGAHQISIQLADGEVALAHLTFAYGMPWDVAPRRAAPIDVVVDGELGARDTRAAALLYVRNRGARLLQFPIVEIELPAGAELDEPSREQLASHLAGQPQQEGRTLLLPLRPLAPGGWVRIPLPARWSVGGNLRGLGAVAYDALGPDTAEVLPAAVLPSREVTLADEGPEPEPPEAEASDDLPIPIPRPIEPLDRLVPEGN
ncbi:MAG: MG2 domain-containing protein [Sandaracinaceae bacterium]